MLYSKRRKNLGGGHKKRSNRRFNLLKGGSSPTLLPKDDIISELRKHDFCYYPIGKNGLKIVMPCVWKISKDAIFNVETETINCSHINLSTQSLSALQNYTINADDHTMDIKLVDIYINFENDWMFANIKNKSLIALLEKYLPAKREENERNAQIAKKFSKNYLATQANRFLHLKQKLS
jgi:hypothetical protein